MQQTHRKLSYSVIFLFIIGLLLIIFGGILVAEAYWGYLAHEAIQWKFQMASLGDMLITAMFACASFLIGAIFIAVSFIIYTIDKHKHLSYKQDQST